MSLFFLPLGLLAALSILAYRESALYERDQMINRLVKESKRRKKEQERKPKRGYAHVQAGYSMKTDDA